MTSKQDEQSAQSAVRTYCRTLTIAGSDSGGGAGIQADLKTFSAIGCYGMSVITALTAQNTLGVTGIHPVPPAFVEEQMAAVFSDIGTDAVKIGMLFSVELIETVTRNLKQFNPSNIVLDPVMVAQSGDRLVQDDAIEAIKELLIPMADVITPNLPEAEVLIGRKISGPDDIRIAAKELAGFGSKSVLIKGGHDTGDESTDIFFVAKEERMIALSGKRIKTKNNHGTGCTLSSAIAAYLAKGCELAEAVTNAKNYIKGAIKAGSEYTIGKGCGPVHHFYKFPDRR
ncbi:MAG: bifunctional hydroxymethylpyrimidine kinase/phosphomethylpyrimidine kinase [Desulfobacterales bacterium]|nr:bifunctional hydroxymethylpyrimidine kinase/phosphomethylpyrimidine kinase [Desulfobacterales bacterium]